MLFADTIISAPHIRPMLNMGCLIDIPTGRYHLGIHGESILCGGLAYLTGIGGMGNVFKSSFADFLELRTLQRYPCSEATAFDTEMSANVHRFYDLALEMPEIAGVDLEEEKRLSVTDNTRYTGTGYFTYVKETLEAKFSDSKKHMRTTPFLDKDKKTFIQSLYPSAVLIDSLSMMSTDSVLKIRDKGEIGESERNMEFMRDGAAKTQMLNELPTLTARTGSYFILTAHMGEKIEMDPMSPTPKQLAFLRQNLRFKGVPPKFTMLMNNCWFCRGISVLSNQGTKAPEYPRDSDDAMKGDTDLITLTIMQLRGKSGGSGIPIEIVVSQGEGVKISLTEFHYIKSTDRFGLGGNDRNYHLELVPDINLSRTTVRGKIEYEPKLKRALEITSEMCQMQQLWHDLPEGLLCTPGQLYTDLIAKGYDWNRLLTTTRGYWIYNEDESPLHFLSTMDLLNMRAGTYHPWWYGELKPVTK